MNALRNLFVDLCHCDDGSCGNFAYKGAYAVKRLDEEVVLMLSGGLKKSGPLVRRASEI